MPASLEPLLIHLPELRGLVHGEVVEQVPVVHELAEVHAGAVVVALPRASGASEGPRQKAGNSPGIRPEGS